MRSGRKNLRKGSEEIAVSLREGHGIMQVVSLRGSNLIEVMDGKGVKSLALFPAKFQKSFWIKRGSFVVVDESGRDEALESGSKIACMVSQVLFHDQIRTLEKSSDWPAIFRTAAVENPKPREQQSTTEPEEDLSSDGDEDMPPLEANLNRSRPVEVYSDSESESESDPES
ncbi:putative RNA-binding protein EIF1AD isoform X1 [Iris pallida]|uniref:RNA-binding protein EIF1AD isoform X1 n=1 Tax=Iris pallida TaxID=29817 RepID=A0AAX6EHS4_IRIPA|nr:putative RNA-binding protein EIF1AD isoform X1 [Iris pallida]